jgi:hypothetical protein
MSEENDIKKAQSQCNNSISTFADKIINTAGSVTSIKEDRITAADKDNIIDWLTNGETALTKEDAIKSNLKEKLDYFFDPQDIPASGNTPKILSIALTIPIWWSGFHTERTDENAPIHDMRQAAIDIGGFSTMSIKLAEYGIFNAQAEYWTNCTTAITTKKAAQLGNVDESTPNKWGAAYSSQYTSRSLKRKPKFLVYFFNKEKPEDVEKTFFFNSEFPLILKYAAGHFYTDKENPIRLYIFDTQKNKVGHCEKVKKCLEAKMNEKIMSKGVLKIHCITGESLTNCATQFNASPVITFGEQRDKNMKDAQKNTDPTPPPPPPLQPPSQQPPSSQQPPQPQQLPPPPSTAQNRWMPSFFRGGKLKYHIRDHIIKQRTKEKSKQRSRKRHIEKRGKQKRKSHKNKPRIKNKFYKTYKIR